MLPQQTVAGSTCMSKPLPTLGVPSAPDSTPMEPVRVAGWARILEAGAEM